MAQKLTPDLIKKRMAGERVSLVGGAGFIGHNLALALRQIGVEVQIVDNLMQNNMLANVSEMDIDDFRRQLNHNFLVQRFEMMRNTGVVMDNADARSMTDLAESLKRFQPTKIVHLSAISSAVDAKKVPGHCFDLQLVTLRNVLEFTRLFPNEVNEVVFMSSSTVYGDFETETVDESVRPRPYGIYANAKFMGERLIRTYHDQYGLGVTIIRPSALYGERCISRRVSQVFIENALMGKPLYLEGGGDGRLDFTYIEDLVDGIVRSMAAAGGTGAAAAAARTLPSASRPRFRDPQPPWDNPETRIASSDASAPASSSPTASATAFRTCLRGTFFAATLNSARLASSPSQTSRSP